MRNVMILEIIFLTTMVALRINRECFQIIVKNLIMSYSVESIILRTRQQRTYKLENLQIGWEIDADIWGLYLQSANIL